MLTYIKPQELKQHWEYVMRGVKRINDKCKDRWDSHDLYLMLKTDRAALYIVNDNDGFVVLQLNDDYDGKNCNVFAAYSDTVDIMDVALPLVKEEAKRVGAKRLTFMSPRNGWNKRAEQLGYKLVSQNFEMEL